MFENFSVGLPLAVFKFAGGVRCELLAGAEVGEIALNVAGGTRSTRGGEANVGGHTREREWKR